MAILVTGAAGLVGRAAVAALLRQDVEHVRAVVREPAQVDGLRRLGAKVALLDATDPDGLAAAMDGVFTACSLTGSLWSPPGEDPYAAVVEPAEVFLAAAGAAGVRRVVVCSPAATGTPNPHLAAKAEVERMVAASGLEHAILRCTHVLGPGSRLLDLLAAGEPVRSRATAASGSPPSGSVTWPRPSPPPTTPSSWPPPGRWPARPRSASTPWSTPSTAGRSPSATSGPPDPADDPDPRRPDPGSRRAGLTPAQAGVLAADSLPDPALPRPPGLVPIPLAETLARAATPAGGGLPGRLDG